jgi:hypothetical protein
MWYQGKLREVGEYPKYRKNKLDKVDFCGFRMLEIRVAKKYEELKDTDKKSQ